MNLRRVFFLAATLPAAAFAQQQPQTGVQPASHRTVPELDGHVFAPSLLVDTPFRETTFQLGLLYGVGKATGPNYEVSGGQVVQNGTASYTFADLAQTFRYEYRFADWLSAGLVVLTNAYTGIDGPSVVSIGASVSVGAGLRAKAGYRFGPVETALVFEASSQPQYGVLVVAALARAIQDGVIDAGSALQSTRTLTYSPTLAASWAPSPAFGLTANAGYLHRTLRTSGTTIADKDGVQLAIAGDFDFAKISSVPIGLLAAYRLTAPLGSDNLALERVDDISGGIFYTGIRELSIGLEVGWRAFEIRPPLDSSGVLAQLGVQYYW